VGHCCTKNIAEDMAFPPAAIAESRSHLDLTSSVSLPQNLPNAMVASKQNSGDFSAAEAAASRSAARLPQL
jgi:hypothetical protein